MGDKDCPENYHCQFLVETKRKASAKGSCNLLANGCKFDDDCPKHHYCATSSKGRVFKNVSDDFKPKYFEMMSNGTCIVKDCNRDQDCPEHHYCVVSSKGKTLGEISHGTCISEGTDIKDI